MIQFNTLLEEITRPVWHADGLHQRAIENTKGARIDVGELEVESERNQHPDQGGTPSVRTGVFWQPSGSHNKYSYSGKGGYGGLEKIKRSLRFKSPLFVKGATGGKAPQMAYDLVKGKGSYEKLRQTVLDAILSIHYHRRSEVIWSVLYANGGDPDLAGQIVDVAEKTGGNNLAYAIQENIVACTVREAGYDAIVGYSVKRDGTPFLSEVFDLVSRDYPVREDV